MGFIVKIWNHADHSGFEYAVRLNDYGIRNHRKFHVHVGVDTGMHRLGERSENIDGICSIMDMKI